MIDAQDQRNERLRAQIKVLDKQIEEINDLEAQKQKFISRMQIIEKLQRSRPEVVHLFDELVKVMPDGTYLTSVKQTGNKLKLEGVAQSSTRVSTLMRNIAASQWLRNPELEVVQTKNDAAGSSFVLDAEQVSVDRRRRQLTAPSDRCAPPRGSPQMSLIDELRALDPRDPGRWPLAVRALAVAVCFVVVAIGADLLLRLAGSHAGAAAARGPGAAAAQRISQPSMPRPSTWRSTSSSWPISRSPSARCCGSCRARPKCRTCWWISRRPAWRRRWKRSCSSPGRKSRRTSTPSCRSISSSPAAITSSAPSSAASRRCRASSRCTTSRSRRSTRTSPATYDQLQLDLTAKTYRYLDDDEIAAAEAEKRKADQAKRHGAEPSDDVHDTTAPHARPLARLAVLARAGRWPAGRLQRPRRAIWIASSTRPRRSPAAASSRCRRSSPTRLSPTPIRICARRSCPAARAARAPACGPTASAIASSSNSSRSTR